MPRHANRPSFYSQTHKSWIIPLSKGVVALVDKDIAKTMDKVNWSADFTGSWRAVNSHHGIFMHRAIMSAPARLEVDHRKHYPKKDKIIDNRRSNLRLCTHKQNQGNRRISKNNKSGFKGVQFSTEPKRRKRWLALIQHNSRVINLGRYMTAEEAACAYDAAAIKLFGTFAATNFRYGQVPQRLDVQRPRRARDQLPS